MTSLSSLPEEVLKTILGMVSCSFLFLAPVCKQWHEFELSNCTNFESIMASEFTIRETAESRGGSETLHKNNAWSFLAKHDSNSFDKMADELVQRIEWDELSVGTAGFYSNLSFFRWLRKTPTLEWDPELALSSSQNQTFLKHMHDFGYAPGNRSCQAAARLGQIPTLRWLKEVGCEMENMQDITQVLAEEGHLQPLQWAISNGFPCDHNTLDAAMYAKKSDVVRYLRNFENIL